MNDADFDALVVEGERLGFINVHRSRHGSITGIGLRPGLDAVAVEHRIAEGDDLGCVLLALLRITTKKVDGDYSPVAEAEGIARGVVS